MKVVLMKIFTNAIKAFFLQSYKPLMSSTSDKDASIARTITLGRENPLLAAELLHPAVPQSTVERVGGS